MRVVNEAQAVAKGVAHGGHLDVAPHIGHGIEGRGAERDQVGEGGVNGCVDRPDEQPLQRCRTI